MRILFRAEESSEYWSRGITVLSPSFPPLSWMSTSTWSLSVAAANALSRGEAAKVFREKPSSSAGRTVAAERAETNFLRFMLEFFLPQIHKLKTMEIKIGDSSPDKNRVRNDSNGSEGRECGFGLPDSLNLIGTDVPETAVVPSQFCHSE